MLLWDPNCRLFKVGEVELGWYALLIVVAFVLGFFLSVFLWRRYFCFHAEYLERDIRDKRALSEDLGCKESEVVLMLNRRLVEVEPKRKISRLLKFASDHLDAIRVKRLKNRLFFDQVFEEKVVSLKERVWKTVGAGWMIIAFGGLLGGRLMYAIAFWEEEFAAQPWKIVSFWDGRMMGLGTGVGLFLGLFFWARWFKGNFGVGRLFDLAAFPVGLGYVFVRIGNFFNQEHVGKVTSVPWGVKFMHPIGAVGGVARHPIQLYEAGLHLVLFVILFCLLLGTGFKIRAGRLGGLYFAGAFGVSLLSTVFRENLGFYTRLPMIGLGQILSVGMICFGIFLFWRGNELYRVGS